MNWYKKAQIQEDFPFLKDVEQIEKYYTDPISASEVDDLITDATTYLETVNILGKNNVNFKPIKLSDETILSLDLSGNHHLITDFYYPQTTDPKEWIYQLSDHEIYMLLPDKHKKTLEEDEDFWNNIEGGVLYHATPSENVPQIMQEGLTPQNQTRGMSNRNTPSGVFMSNNPDDIHSYGDVVIEIDVGKMKDDGYMPRTSRESPIEEASYRSMLANLVGIEDSDFTNELYGEGVYDTTQIFYEGIPPKYLKVME